MRRARLVTKQVLLALALVHLRRHIHDLDSLDCTRQLTNTRRCLGNFLFPYVWLLRPSPLFGLLFLLVGDYIILSEHLRRDDLGVAVFDDQHRMLEDILILSVTTLPSLPTRRPARYRPLFETWKLLSFRLTTFVSIEEVFPLLF